MTNSLKAEHYLTSGLNRIPTSVGTIQDCVNHAFNPDLLEDKKATIQQKAQPQHASSKTQQNGDCSIVGGGLNSQGDWVVEGVAMVTDVPITYLGYVNRDTGVIEETGHPLDGRAIEDKVLIYPKGSGSQGCTLRTDRTNIHRQGSKSDCQSRRLLSDIACLQFVGYTILAWF